MIFFVFFGCFVLIFQDFGLSLATLIRIRNTVLQDAEGGAECCSVSFHQYNPVHRQALGYNECHNFCPFFSNLNLCTEGGVQSRVHLYKVTTLLPPVNQFAFSKRFFTFPVFSTVSFLAIRGGIKNKPEFSNIF